VSDYLDLPTIDESTCNSCGACCLHIGIPPFFSYDNDDFDFQALPGHLKQEIWSQSDRRLDLAETSIFSDCCASPPRTARRRAAAGPLLRPDLQPPPKQNRRIHSRRRDGCARQLFVAWEYPRTRKPDRKSRIASAGKELRVPIGELKAASAAFSAAADAGEQSANPLGNRGGIQRCFISHCHSGRRRPQHILRALRPTNWRNRRAAGCRNLIGMKRTTLQARIRKLGIRRPV